MPSQLYIIIISLQLKPGVERSYTSNFWYIELYITLSHTVKTAFYDFGGQRLPGLYDENSVHG